MENSKKITYLMKYTFIIRNTNARKGTVENTIIFNLSIFANVFENYWHQNKVKIWSSNLPLNLCRKKYYVIFILTWKRGIHCRINLNLSSSYSIIT